MAALYKQQLGEMIRQLREDLGMTQKQLADRAHVAESQTVSRWERGERAPQDLEAVATALQTTVPEMLRRLEPLGQRQRKSMNADEGRSQLDRIEGRLAAAEAREAKFQALIDRQNGLLAEQSRLIRDMSAVLKRIDGAIAVEDEAARRLAADGEAWADEALARYRAALHEPETPAPARKARAKSAIRQG